MTFSIESSWTGVPSAAALQRIWMTNLGRAGPSGGRGGTHAGKPTSALLSVNSPLARTQWASRSWHADAPFASSSPNFFLPLRSRPAPSAFSAAPCALHAHSQSHPTLLCTLATIHRLGIRPVGRKACNGEETFVTKSGRSRLGISSKTSSLPQ